MSIQKKIIRTFSKIGFAVIALPIFLQCAEEETLSAQSTTPIDTATVSVRAATPTSCSTCTYVVPSNQPTVDGEVLGFKPGDVICFSASNKYTGTLTFKNIIGTQEKPIIITNCGGTVNLTVTDRPWNFKTSNSKFFRITGGNTPGAYGIRISGSTVNGLVLCEQSTNIEVDHVEVFKVGFAGVMAKTDPTCDNATIRGNFTMKNLYLHDNYIHDTGGEGFYVGHTSYNGYSTSCGTRLPHLIENAKIYNNRIKNAGWDALQLSCASVGAEVYGNVIENYSVKNVKDQTGGILIGGGTGGVCYGNYINGGNGPGIVVFGLADNLIHNNVVVNAGTMGMFCDERTTPGKGFRFINNTIINPKTEGIRIYSEDVDMNVFVNNIIVNPGSYATAKENAYVTKLGNSVPLQMSNNYFTTDVNAVKFVDAASFNYRLTSGSPTINTGTDVSAYQTPLDFYKSSRLKGNAYDIGASEY